MLQGWNFWNQVGEAKWKIVNLLCEEPCRHVIHGLKGPLLAWRDLSRSWESPKRSERVLSRSKRVLSRSSSFRSSSPQSAIYRPKDGAVRFTVALSSLNRILSSTRGPLTPTDSLLLQNVDPSERLRALSDQEWRNNKAKVIRLQ